MSIYDGQAYHTNQTHYLRAVVGYADTSAISVGWLPKGALITAGAATVTTAFNSGTSNVMDIGFRNAGDGTADDTDEFATDLDVSSVGRKVADELASAGDLYFPEGAEIVATHTPSGTAADAGSAIVTIEYTVPNDA